MISDTAKDSFSIVGALITAGAALTGALASKFWDANIDRKSRRRVLVIRYLSQLQTTLQILESRLYNLLYQNGRAEMTTDYFRFTTLYALACPLALEHIFMLDGVYPQISEFNEGLYSHLHRWSLDRQLINFGFHRYDRLALAECAMERDGSGLRLATYFEFRDRYEHAISRGDVWLQSAFTFADRITQEKDRMTAIMASMHSVVAQLADHTGILRREDENQVADSCR
jgi:hypothetical protein